MFVGMRRGCGAASQHCAAPCAARAAADCVACALVRRGGRRGQGAVRAGHGGGAAPFPELEDGSPSPAAVAALLTARDPASLQRVRRRLEAWAAVLDGAGSALAGKSRRRAFAAAAARAGASGAGLRRRSPPGTRPGDGR